MRDYLNPTPHDEQYYDDEAYLFGRIASDYRRTGSLESLVAVSPIFPSFAAELQLPA